MVEILQQCPLFMGLNGLAVVELFDNIKFRQKVFEKEIQISTKGETVREMNLLLKGSVRGEMTDYSGKTIKIEDIYPCRPLAPAFLFGNANVYPVDIITNEPSEILSIPREEFVKLLQQNDRVLTNYLNMISGRAQFLAEKLHFMTFQSIRGKIARFLIEQSGQTNSMTFEIPFSQNELAERFGVTRPALTRVLRELHHEKILNSEKKTITILDKNKLIQFLK